MAPTAVLRLAPGRGVVARRSTAVLFAPGRDEALYAAFVDSPPGGELQAVASATVAAGFSVDAFVALSWGDDVQVMAFGELAVVTDQPSLPMLTGSGSRTWVEHSLRPGGDAVIEVLPDEAVVDPASDLAAGVVPAGGFRLELHAAAEAIAPATSEPADVDQPTSAVPRAPAALQPPLGPPVVPPPDPSDPDVTLPPLPVGDLLPAVAGPDERGSLVAARCCSEGHPNPTTAAACERCGELLPAGAGVVHVPRPSLGRLRLDDGQEIELADELLIGRNPDRDDTTARQDLRRVKVHGDKVSRSHLEIRYQGWDILVADCGSTNGTFVVSHPGGQVAPVEPGKRQLLEPGATVYFGSRSFTVVGRDGVMSTDPRLHVDFCGEVTTVEPGADLTFGRAGDLHIDDNRHLHRTLGRFWTRGDAWWLTNEGRAITIQIADADSRSSIVLAPGSEVALSFPNSILRFRAGVTDYELLVRVPDRDDDGVLSHDDLDDLDDLDNLDDELVGDTIALGDVPLTDEQRLLLLALAEPTLRDPHGTDELPANRAAARRLGWSITKFNRKLDNLCSRFSKLGVGGLRGSVDQLATDRRRRLVEHAVESSLITAAQLDRLPPEPD